MLLDMQVSKWIAYVLVTLTATGCYINTLPAQLVHDDIFAIVENDDVKAGTPLSQLFWNDFWGKAMSNPTSHKSYRPLTVLTFRLNYAIHGLRPLGYHAFNVVMHCLATLLFLNTCWHVIFTNCNGAALLAGLLFATHPIHTEAVAGIVGRADILACIFLLLSFLCYQQSICQPDHLKELFPTCHSPLLFTLSLLLGSLAMLFKENGVTSLGVCLCYDILIASAAGIKKTLTSKSKMTLSDTRPLLLRVFFVMITLLAVMSLRLSLLYGQLPQFLEEDNPASFSKHLSTRVMTFMYLCVVNCWLLVAPVSLCYDWQMGSIPLVESLLDWRNLTTLLLLLTMTTIIWLLINGKLAAQTHHVVTIALIFLIIPYLPASNLFVRVGFVIAERILYMPSMGYCIMVVQGCVILSREFHWYNGGRSHRKWPSYVLIGIVLLLATKTVNRNTVWYSRETLFRSGLNTIPHNAKIHYNYANYLKDHGRVPEAISHYRNAVMLVPYSGKIWQGKSSELRCTDRPRLKHWSANVSGSSDAHVRLAPDHASSHNNLATLLMGEEAELHYREAVKHNPGHYRAFYNLGNLLVKQGRTKDGAAALSKAIELKPDYTEALVAYASTLIDQGANDDAINTMERAISLVDNDADMFNNYGAFYARLGYQLKAITAYQRAISINSDHSVALRNLARIQRFAGKDKEAELLYKRSLLIEPTAEAYHGLGALFFNSDRMKEAKDVFEHLLRMEPDHVEGICGYAQVLAKLGQSEESIKLLTQLSHAHPSNTEPLQHLGVVQATRGEFEQALTTADKGLSIQPDNAQLLKLKGDILKDLENMPAAEKYYEKALQVSPDDGAIHTNLGVLLHLRGAYEQAKVHYEHALAKDPHNEVLLTNMRKLERAMRKQNN